MTDNGVYFGRFQPFHIEHLARVKEISVFHPSVNLIVGVADWRGDRSKSNFLLIQETLKIVELSLRDIGMDKVRAVGVPLFPGIDLRDSIKPFIDEYNIDYIFSGSDKTLKSARELGNSHLTVVDLKDSEGGVRATDVRNSIVERTNLWRSRLTPSAVKYVESLLPDLERRLTSLPDGQKRPWTEQEAYVPNPERR